MFLKYFSIKSSKKLLENVIIILIFFLIIYFKITNNYKINKKISINNIKNLIKRYLNVLYLILP